MSPFWERVSFLLSYIVQGTSYLSPYAYAVMHRMHHAYTDTPKDPHSPSYDKNLFAMMWRTKKVYFNVRHHKKEVEDRFKKNVPHWPMLDRIGHSGYSRLAWGALYVAFYAVFAPSAWFFLLLPIHFFMGPIQGAIINWFAHRVGHVNHKMENTSKNLMPFDIFMLGEGYHNNHHRFPSRIKFSEKWFEIDPVYPIIVLFNWLGIVRLNKAVASTADSKSSLSKAA